MHVRIKNFKRGADPEKTSTGRGTDEENGKTPSVDALRAEVSELRTEVAELHLALVTASGDR